MRVRTCEAGVAFDVFTREEDTCEVFVSAMARVCVRYSGVLHVCMYTMLDSTTQLNYVYKHTSAREGYSLEGHS